VRLNLELQKMEGFASRYTEYVKVLRSRADSSKLDELAEFRRIDRKAFDEAGVFYIKDMAELLVPDYLDIINDFGIISNVNGKPIFHERYVIPILNTKGKVINLVGYSWLAPERYVYGTAKYYRRKDTLYGLENLHLAYEMGYAVLVEGITDAIRLKSLGIKNVFANCGTHRSPFITAQLNRCRYGIIKIPDRDNAGIKANRQWEFSRHITIFPPAMYKDIDEMLRDKDNIGWFLNYFNECVKILLDDRRKYLKGKILETTII